MDFPERVIVDIHGCYWRDYGDHYSMPPVSNDNDPITTAAVYIRASDAQKALRKAAVDFVWTTLRDCKHDFEGHDLHAIENYMINRWQRAA